VLTLALVDIENFSYYSELDLLSPKGASKTILSEIIWRKAARPWSIDRING
jgi:hypothetical protein